MHLYKRLLGFALPYWPLFLVAMFCLIMVSASVGGSAWIVKPVLDDIFIRKDMFMLRLLPLAVVLLYLIKGVFTYLSTFLMNYLGQKVVRDMRLRLYAHIQTLSLRFFTNHHTGALMSRLTNDVNLIQGAVSSVVSDFVREIFSMASLLVVVFYRDWRLATLSVFILPFCMYFMAGMGRKLRRLGSQSQAKMADMSTVLEETFAGVRMVKAFGMEHYEIERFGRENNRFFHLLKKTIKYNEIQSPIMEFLGAIGLGVIVWYGGSRVISGVTTAGTFFSFMAALMMLYAPVRKLSRVNSKLQGALAASERIFEILDIGADIEDRPGAIELPPMQHGIEFRHVSFQYDLITILEGISFQVRRGEVVAIVGTSGVGKTTLVDLLPRFYDVTSGSITIDGIDIREVTLQSLRRQIGIVSQEVFLFNDTVRNNIAYGNRAATDAQIQAAAEGAFAHPFILEMPQGYDTVIGERGVKLSGGQRQRIAIARALIKNPPILILDEATSALDTESERMVQQALNNLMRHRTTFVVAHRLSTVVDADRIMVLHNGRIAEVGSHHQLLKAGGLYSKIYEMQFQTA